MAPPGLVDVTYQDQVLCELSVPVAEQDQDVNNVLMATMETLRDCMVILVLVSDVSVMVTLT